MDGGDTVSVGGVDFGTIAVPGHSRDSIAYYAHGFVFSGDVLFSGSVGRTDFEGGGHAAAAAEHRRDVRDAAARDRGRCPGMARSTTLEAELATNPFLAELRP